MVRDGCGHAGVGGVREARTVGERVQKFGCMFNGRAGWATLQVGGAVVLGGARLNPGSPFRGTDQGRVVCRKASPKPTLVKSKKTGPVTGS